MKPVCLPEKYEILGELGTGGMGFVYHARDRVLNREVALKVLSDHCASNPEFAKRFLVEARAVASLNHPNIVQIYECGETDNGHFLAMELVRGDTLKMELKKAGRFSESQTINLALKACRALAVAHGEGIIHRDVKPDNIMFTEDGDFKLVDLGLAKCMKEEISNTVTGQAMGTPHFISPEQILGERTIDERADIYSLGATMYNLATGQVPFHGSSGAHIMSKHLNDPLPDPRQFSPELSSSFCKILGRMMAKDPGDRYQAMPELELELRLLQQGKPASQVAAVPTAVENTVFSSSPEFPALKPRMPIFDERSLDLVTRKLAESIGPLAKVLVQKIGARASSWDELSHGLSSHIISRQDRDEFMQACARISEGGGSTIMGRGSSGSANTGSARGLRTISMGPQAMPSFELEPDKMEEVVRLLADRIGPVARTLVRRELKKAHDLKDLTAKLAQAIPHPDLRHSFSKAMELSD